MSECIYNTKYSVSFVMISVFILLSGVGFKEIDSKKDIKQIHTGHAKKSKWEFQPLVKLVSIFE